MEMIEAVAYGNEPAVLEDASGRRARWMRRAGRAVFVLFLAWLVAIVLGGLGLTPVPQPVTRNACFLNPRRFTARGAG